MKIKSILFLVVFVGFLITPAVITCVKKDANISFLFSMNEEEKTPTPKVESEKLQSLYQLNITSLISEYFTVINFNFHSIGKWNNIYFETISPPPEYSFSVA